MAMEWLFTMRRPSEERTPPRVAVRRAAAVLAIAAYPLALLLTSARSEILPGLGVVPFVLLAMAVVAVWALSFNVIHEFRRRLAQAREEELDERERAVRDEAYLIAYRILGGVLMLMAVVVLAVVPMFLGSREISLDLVLHAFFTLVIVAAALPSAVVAWRDTDSGELDELDDPEPVGSGPADRAIR